MGSARISRSHWLALAGLVATLAIAAASCDPAQARVKSKRDHPRPRAIHGPNYHPPYADIVVDDKSGLVLHEVSADEPRHPASLTKIMTLCAATKSTSSRSCWAELRMARAMPACGS
jgi:D-alanyl-D-alanine carboxypeptidase